MLSLFLSAAAALAAIMPVLASAAPLSLEQTLELAEQRSANVLRGHVDRRVGGNLGLLREPQGHVQDVLGVHRPPGANGMG